MSTSDLSSLRSVSPEFVPVQPDHFYGQSSPTSPDSDKGYLDPDDDPLATRGIPVFRPNIQDFNDFEGYMSKVECWGMKSGIVKIIPPKEWTSALPSTVPQLANVRLRSPIEQQMAGRGGLYRQQNVEKRRIMTAREWAELCAKEDFRAPTIAETQGVRRHAAVFTLPRPKRGSAEGESQNQGTQEHHREGSMDEIKEDDDNYNPKTEEAGEHKPDDDGDGSMEEDKPDVRVDPASSLPTPPPTTTTPETTPSVPQPTTPPKPSAAERKEAKEALDKEFLSTFEPHKAWLPQGMKAEDYTPEFCRTLERIYWRNCSLGRAPWYGADMKGSLFTDATRHWNVATLPSVLSRLLGDGSKISGVNTPYLYFGMWRATFAWHVEDMDLFSINYIHFGAPKHWYAVPQARSQAFEAAMKGYFSRDNTACPQFLRHKSFLVSPTLLSQSSVRPNVLVQHAGEFVVTFPRGYHAGFNLGLNCAESVNFALQSWVELGLRATFCVCEPDSVRIDVRGLLAEKERRERDGLPEEKKKVHSRKRKVEGLAPEGGNPSKSKRPKTFKAMPASPDSNPSVPSTKSKPKVAKAPKQTKPADFDPGFTFPCCLCASTTLEGLLRVHDPPASFSGVVKPSDGVWRAHEACANVVPETWVDEIPAEGRPEEMERVVWGVDGIVKDRWSLKCAACSRPRAKAHGAPIQCTKGKCSKAFHVSCAASTNDSGVAYRVIEEVEKEVVLLDSEGESMPAPAPPPALGTSNGMDIDQHQPPPLSSAIAGSLDTTGGIPPTPASNPPSSIPPSSVPSAPPVPSPSATPAVAVPKKEGPRVIKTIKKLLVEVLCPQHNPILIAQKKLGKVDQMRKDLAALGEMSRIRIRNASGVLEVTLIKVLEERGTVEVLWDGGQKREFKWGSIVWGERQSTGSMPTVEDLSKRPHLPPPPSGSTSIISPAAGPAAPAGPPAYVPPAINQQQAQHYNPYSQPAQASFPSSNYMYTQGQPCAGPSRPQYQGMSQFRAAPQPVPPSTARPPAQLQTSPSPWTGQVTGYPYAPSPHGYPQSNGPPQYHGYYAHPYYQPHSPYAHAQSPSTLGPQQLPPLRPYPTQPGNTATGQARPNQPASVPAPYGGYYPPNPYLPLAPHPAAGIGSATANQTSSPARSSGETSTTMPGLRQEETPSSSSSSVPAMSSLDAPS